MSAHQGRQRIPARKLARIFALIDAGVSYRRIARLCGCHYNTPYRLQRARTLADKKLAERLEQDDGPKRCPTCGVLCDPPCLACRRRRTAIRPVQSTLRSR